MAEKIVQNNEVVTKIAHSANSPISRHIVVNDADTDKYLKKTSSVEPTVEHPKITIQTKVSSPNLDHRVKEDELNKAENRPLRRSAPAVVAPIISVGSVKNEEPQPAKDLEYATEEQKKQPSSLTSNELKQQEYDKLNQRTQEIEKIINSHKYFVPINMVAQKRSIKVSLGLLFLALILAILLIDLMFDSGLILFVNSLPHTHFFSVR